MEQDIRWKQRFQNYEKALNNLTEFIEKGKLNEFEEQGLIKCFEYTFELAWKTLKDYLKDDGFENIAGPKSTITEAFKENLISDGEGWMDILKNRNLTTHTYDEEVVKKITKNIYKIYYPLFVELRNRLEKKVGRFGLKEEIIEKICGVFRMFSEIEKVIIYGSRAKGNYKNGSDIDITLVGENLDFDIITKLDLQLDELYLPYSFDISIFDRIKNPDLVEHIERVGIAIYVKQ
jgi:nucleotidyltransferase substrate binding protein (TIGR01987 family)